MRLLLWPKPATGGTLLLCFENTAQLKAMLYLHHSTNCNSCKLYNSCKLIVNHKTPTSNNDQSPKLLIYLIAMMDLIQLVQLRLLSIFRLNFSPKLNLCCQIWQRLFSHFKCIVLPWWTSWNIWLKKAPCRRPPPLFFTLHDPYSEILPQLTHFTTLP